MGIPLDHDVRVIGEPDRAVFGRLATPVVQQLLVPALVDRATGLAQTVGHAHGLHRILRPEFPAQIFAGHKVAQAGVEGADVVILQVDLDKGFPVVVAVVHFHVVQHIAAEIEFSTRAQSRHIGCHITALAFKQQTIPFLQRVVVEIQAGVGGKVRCAYQLAAGALRVHPGVGPAVQGADDIATGRCRALAQQRATALEHQCLAVAADVGDEFDPLAVAHQGASTLFLRQGVVVAQLRHAQGVAHIAGTALENMRHFARIERSIEIAGDRKLAVRLLQLKT